MHVKEMTPDNPKFKRTLIEESKRIVDAQNAEIIVPFGTSFLTSLAFTSEISREVGVPFVDCVAAGLRTAEMLVGMGMKNSRRAYPFGG